MMEIVGPAAFIADPVDKAVVEEGFAVFMKGDRLAGQVIWGRVEQRDVELSFELLDAILAQPGPALDIVIEARSVEVGNQAWAQFAQMFKAAKVRTPLIDRRVARVATVAAQHIGGQALSAAHLVLGGSYEARSFRRLEDVFGWIERDDAAALIAWISRAPAMARERSPLIAALRDKLASRPSSALEAVASALDLPARQLQRSLARLGTTFKDEQRAASIRVAQALLDEPSRGLDEVARGAGFRSTAQLVRAYRTVTGKAPREP